MLKIFRQFALGAVVAASIASLPARASVVIDFNDPSLESAYAPLETFSQNGFDMTQLFDAGLVGGNADLGSVAPVGDSTPYYSNFNNGALLITRTDGGTFTLESFDLAFVPLVPPPSGGQTLYLGIISFDADGNSDFPFIFPFADSTASGYPFETWNDPSIAAAYKDVSGLEFFTCSVDASFNCIDTLNNGQFALDNVTLAIPEPTTAAMMALGLVGLVGHRVRSRRNRA